MNRHTSPWGRIVLVVVWVVSLLVPGERVQAGMAVGRPTGSASLPAPIMATQHTASATTVPPEASCWNLAYPMLLHVSSLEDRAGHWYKPVTLAAVGLSPDADARTIPSVNTTNPASPRFRVWRTSNAGAFVWTRWNSRPPSGSIQDLEQSLTGDGNLAAGLSERLPPANDPAAIRLLNNYLEGGDWLSEVTGNVNSAGIAAALDDHISRKTHMRVVVYDAQSGGDGSGFGYRVTRFAEVRLLAYTLAGPAPFLEFALIAEDWPCTTAKTPTPSPAPTVSAPLEGSVPGATETTDGQHRRGR